MGIASTKMPIHLPIWKKMALFFMAGSLLILATACGSSNNTDSSPEIGSTEEMVEKETTGSDYYAEGIVLPEHFESMIYPLEALVVEQYSQGLSYYKDGDKAESFWFPMAVLSSLIAENEDIALESDDEYHYYDEEQITQLASALFYDYANKVMPLAPLNEDSPYAFYDEETQRYGLLSGNIGDLGIRVTNCSKVNQAFELEVELRNVETKDVVSEYLLTVYPQKNAKASDPFLYAVASCDPIESGEIDELGSEIEDGDGPSIDEDFDIVDGDEVTDGSQENDVEIRTQLSIDKDEALALAKAYMGEDYTFSYRGTVTIGEYDYYDFAIKEKESKDVLVCINGLDVVSGRHNKDGSWSFDQ